jgi:SAM-dependent methyltransferase
MNKFLEVLGKEKIHRSLPGLKFYLGYLYDGVDFNGKNVLEIGAGNGIHSFFAADRGAYKIIAIEPEEKGSRNGFIDTFNKLRNMLGFDNVFLKPVTFQDFSSQNAGEKFNIIISHNSINHLDEEACITLMEKKESVGKYRKIFRDLYEMSSNGAQLVISDCSPRNFFNDIGMKNPFTPTIEWRKHQTPEVWIKLLEEAGFKNPKIRWLSPYHLRKIGVVLLGNKVASYFIHSHFSIRMVK